MNNTPTSDERLGMEHAVSRAFFKDKKGISAWAWAQTEGWVSQDTYTGVETNKRAGRDEVALRIHRLTLSDYRSVDYPANAIKTIEFRRFEVRSLVAAGLKLLGPIEAIGALDDESEPQQVTT